MQFDLDIYVIVKQLICVSSLAITIQCLFQKLQKHSLVLIVPLAVCLFFPIDFF